MLLKLKLKHQEIVCLCFLALSPCLLALKQSAEYAI